MRKVANNIAEIKARGVVVVAVGTDGDEDLAALVDHMISIPEVPDHLYPLMETIPLQLFAYHIAVLNEREVDKPRNLAKSVTVE